MGRTRRYIPQLIIAFSVAALVIPLLIVFSVPEPTRLPRMSINALLRVTVISYAIPVFVVLCATILAACIVFTCYTRLEKRFRHGVVVLCILPILVPPVSLAMAVEEVIPSLALPVACTMVAFSYSVIAQIIALHYVDPLLLSTLRDLGAKPPFVWRRVILPVWRRGAVLGALWAMIVLVSDSSLYEVFGGTQSFLASHILRAAIGGASMMQVFPVLCAYLLPGLCVTVLVVRSLGKIRWKKPQYLAEAMLHNIVRGLPVPGIIRTLTATITATCLGVIVLTFSIFLGGAVIALKDRQSIDVSSLLPTTALIALVLPISAFGALVWATAIHRARSKWRHIGWGTVISCIFLSPVVGGVILALGGRIIRGDQFFLSGYAMLVLAGISLCLPLSTLLIVVMRSLQHGSQVEIARDLGAPTLRIALQVEGPTIYPIVFAVLCLQVTMILTSVAPFVFIETTEVTTIPVHIASLAAAHLSAQVFLITCIGAMITGVAIVAVVIIFRSIVRIPYRGEHA